METFLIIAGIAVVGLLITAVIKRFGGCADTCTCDNPPETAPPPVKKYIRFKNKAERNAYLAKVRARQDYDPNWETFWEEDGEDLLYMLAEMAIMDMLLSDLPGIDAAVHADVLPPAYPLEPAEQVEPEPEQVEPEQVETVPDPTPEQVVPDPTPAPAETADQSAFDDLSTAPADSGSYDSGDSGGSYDSGDSGGGDCGGDD